MLLFNTNSFNNGKLCFRYKAYKEYPTHPPFISTQIQKQNKYVFSQKHLEGGNLDFLSNFQFQQSDQTSNYPTEKTSFRGEKKNETEISWESWLNA